MNYLCSNWYSTPHCSEQNSLELLSSPIWSPQFLQCPFFIHIDKEQISLLLHLSMLLNHSWNIEWGLRDILCCRLFNGKLNVKQMFCDLYYSSRITDHNRSIPTRLSDIFAYGNMLPIAIVCFSELQHIQYVTFIQ